MVNQNLHVGLAVETAFGIISSYIWWIGIGLGTRPIACPHFLVPAFSYFCLILFYDETRKVFLRNGVVRGADNRLKFQGWIVRNTFY